MLIVLQGLEKAPGPRYMSHYWRENHLMVVQGPALGKVLSLPGVVPVGFKTSGRTNNVLQSFLHLWAPSWGAQRQAHCSCWHWEERRRSRQEGFPSGAHSHLTTYTPEPSHPGWDCGVEEEGFTCPGFFCRKKRAQSYLSCL